MGLTILLVDDDQILTEKTKNSLNWDSLGIGMVFTANNIHEAKGILKVYKVDILLCDVDMPMGSGLELVEWIREEGMEIKCIFLSSYANFTYAQKALRLGSVNYLLKPISNKDLEAELNTVCDELLKEHTNLNSQEKKQREEVWKKVLVQALSDGVGTSNTSSLSDAQYSELYPSVQPITLVPICKPISSREKATFTSSNKKVVKVDSKGRIKALKPGKATITVKVGNKKVKFKVTVKK